MLFAEQRGAKEAWGSCIVVYSDVAGEGGRCVFFLDFAPCMAS